MLLVLWFVGYIAVETLCSTLYVVHISLEMKIIVAGLHCSNRLSWEFTKILIPLVQCFNVYIVITRAITSLYICILQHFLV